MLLIGLWECVKRPQVDSYDQHSEDRHKKLNTVEFHFYPIYQLSTNQNGRERESKNLKVSSCEQENIAGLLREAQAE